MSIENRRHRRLKLVSIPAEARLVTVEGRTELSFRPVDVSKSGLGLLIAERLAVGQAVIMSIDGNEITLVIRWAGVERADHHIFRYGLQATDDQIDLENVFFALGCLEEEVEFGGDL